MVPAPSHAALPSLAGGLAGADDSVGAVSLLDASDPMASANQEVLEEAGSDYVPAHEEIVEYARWLGIRPDEDASMLWIAKEGSPRLSPGLEALSHRGRTGVLLQLRHWGERLGPPVRRHLPNQGGGGAREARRRARGRLRFLVRLPGRQRGRLRRRARQYRRRQPPRLARRRAAHPSQRRVLPSKQLRRRRAVRVPEATRRAGTPSPRPVGGPVPRVTRSPLAALDQNTLNGARNDPKRAAAARAAKRASASSARAEPEVGGASVRSDAPAPAPAFALDRDVDLDRSGASDRSDGSVRSSRRGRLAMLPSRGEPSRPKPSLALNLEGVGGGAANDADASADASEIMVESFSMDESLDESSDRSVASARSGRSSRGLAAATAARADPTPANDDEDEDDTPDASAFIVGGGFDSPPESPGFGAATKDRSLGSRNDPAAGVSAPLASTGAFGDGVGTRAAERSFPSLDLDDDPEPERDEGGDAPGLGATRASERSVPSLVLDDEEDESEAPPRATTATTGATLTTSTTSTSSATGRSTFRATARSTADSDKAEALSMLLASDDDEDPSSRPEEAEYSAEWDEDDAEGAGSNPAEVDLGGRVKMSASGKFKPLRAPQTTTAVEEQKTTTAEAEATEAEERTISAAAGELPRRARGSRMLRDAMNFSRDSDDSQSPSPSPRAEEEKTRPADETAAERVAAATAAEAATARADRAERAAAEAAATVVSLGRQLEVAREGLERERRRAEAEVAEERARAECRGGGAREGGEGGGGGERGGCAGAAVAGGGARNLALDREGDGGADGGVETGTAAHEKALRAEVATFERTAKALVDRASARRPPPIAPPPPPTEPPTEPPSPRHATARVRVALRRERTRGAARVVASPAASARRPRARGAGASLSSRRSARRATRRSRLPPARSPRATPGSSRTPSRRVPAPPERFPPPADDPMETLTDVSSSLDDSLSPRGSVGGAARELGIRGRSRRHPRAKPQTATSSGTVSLGRLVGSGLVLRKRKQLRRAPDSGGGGTPPAARFDRGVTSRATRAPPRAPVDTTRRYTAKEARSPPQGGGRRRRGRGAKMRFVRASRFGPGRRRLDPIRRRRRRDELGTRRHLRGTQHAARALARPGSCPRALRRRRSGSSRVARARRWWQVGAATRGARGGVQDGEGFGECGGGVRRASRKLEEWLDRERRSLGSFRRVAAILG